MRHPMLCLLAVAACGGQAPAPASSAVPTAPLVIGKRTAPRACVPAARVYVTLTPLTNKTGRPTAELDAIVRSAIVRKLEAAPEVVLSKESHVAGRCELVLGPGVRAFEYGGGNLRVSFDLSVRRPDGTLIGGAPKSLSKEGVGNADHASEDQVLTRAAELGYEAASTNRVAEVAGVSIGSLYQYFPSKAALLSELIERHMKSMLAVLATTAREGETSSIEEATRTIIRAVFAAHRVNPKLHRVLVEQMARLGTLEAVESFEAQAQALVEAFLTAHRAELRPKNVKAAARVAVLAVRGVTLWTVLRNAEQLADDEFIDEITDMVTRYLLKRAGG